MRLFSKKIYLLNISYSFRNRDKETINIIDSYADLKPVEFVYLTLNQFAKILYTVPKNLSDTKYTRTVSLTIDVSHKLKGG